VADVTAVAVVREPEAATRLEFRGAALEMMRRQDTEVLMSGPAGTGKSVACLWKLHLIALMYPGMRGLIVRKTAASLGSTALVTWRERVAREAIAAGLVSFYGGSAAEPPQYRYVNGSAIVVGGMDRSTRIMSSEYDVVFVQEAIELTEDDWESITTRLRHGVVPFQQLIGDTNPDRPTHWLNERSNRGTTAMLQSRHRDNPALFDDDGNATPDGQRYLSTLARLTGVRKARLEAGKWVAAEGVIYEGWDDAVNLLDRPELPPLPEGEPDRPRLIGETLPPDWPRYWGVDFGFTNPFVCQCWAVDGDGRLYLEWEVYRTRRTVDEHAVTILDQVSVLDPRYVHRDSTPRRAYQGRIWYGPRPTRIICDHDSGDRALLQRELGIVTKAARKNVTGGIQAVQKRIRPADDGRPRLFLLRDAAVERDPDLVEAKKPTCTQEELPGYVWDIQPGKPVKEIPRKEDDHGMDTKRYVVAEIDMGSRPGIRTM
jgi:hypothetical protein